MLAGYDTIYLEIASSAPSWLYNDKETLTTAFGTLPFSCYVNFLPPLSYSQWSKLSKKGRVDKMFLLYESACVTLPQVECNINHYRLAVEHVISKVGQTAVETARVPLLKSPRLNTRWFVWYSCTALTSGNNIYSSSHGHHLLMSSCSFRDRFSLRGWTG